MFNDFNEIIFNKKYIEYIFFSFLSKLNLHIFLDKYLQKFNISNILRFFKLS